MPCVSPVLKMLAPPPAATSDSVTLPEKVWLPPTPWKPGAISPPPTLVKVTVSRLMAASAPLLVVRAIRPALPPLKPASTAPGTSAAPPLVVMSPLMIIAAAAFVISIITLPPSPPAPTVETLPVVTILPAMSTLPPLMMSTKPELVPTLPAAVVVMDSPAARVTPSVPA